MNNRHHQRQSTQGWGKMFVMFLIVLVIIQLLTLVLLGITLKHMSTSNQHLDTLIKHSELELEGFDGTGLVGVLKDIVSTWHVSQGSKTLAAGLNQTLVLFDAIAQTDTHRLINRTATTLEKVLNVLEGMADTGVIRIGLG